MRKIWILAAVIAGCSTAPAPRQEMKSQDKTPTASQEDGKKLLPIEIVSKYRAGALAWENPQDACWKDAPATKLKLIPQQVQEPMLMTPTIGEMTVKALHNDGWIAFQLEWADASCSNTLRSDRFGDACAVSFPLGDQPLPDFRMGDETRPVHLMFWRAERQRAVEDKVSFFSENYPNAWSDTYIFEPTAVGYVVSEALLTEAKRAVGSQAAENPFRIGVAPIVEELSARTWNKLTRQASQDARGRGVWRDGKWTVVIVRPLATSDDEDAGLSAKKSWAVTFAAWDGGRQNAGPRKMTAEGWIQLKLSK